MKHLKLLLSALLLSASTTWTYAQAISVDKSTISENDIAAKVVDESTVPTIPFFAEQADFYVQICDDNLATKINRCNVDFQQIRRLTNLCQQRDPYAPLGAINRFAAKNGKIVRCLLGN